MGGVETMRPQTVLWDTTIDDQIREAKERIAKLVAEGFRIIREGAGECALEPPAKPEYLNVFRILSQNGDDRVVWDRTDPLQVKEAFRKFKELVAKGYTAFVTLANGKRGHKITEFDPGLEEILMAPGTEVMMVPKTVPG
jgi:hypothetical protein